MRVKAKACDTIISLSQESNCHLDVLKPCFVSTSCPCYLKSALLDTPGLQVSCSRRAAQQCSCCGSLRRCRRCPAAHERFPRPGRTHKGCMHLQSALQSASGSATPPGTAKGSIPASLRTAAACRRCRSSWCAAHLAPARGVAAPHACMRGRRHARCCHMTAGLSLQDRGAAGAGVHSLRGQVRLATAGVCSCACACRRPAAAQLLLLHACALQVAAVVQAARVSGRRSALAAVLGACGGGGWRHRAPQQVRACAEPCMQRLLALPLCPAAQSSLATCLASQLTRVPPPCCRAAARARRQRPLAGAAVAAHQPRGLRSHRAAVGPPAVPAPLRQLRQRRQRRQQQQAARRWHAQRRLGQRRAC